MFQWLQIFPKKVNFVFTFDLKSAYHIIELFQDHREYLGFSLEDEEERHFYRYNVLLFGISTAGFIFTKLMRITLRHMRSVGQKLVMFLDDGMGGHNDFSLAKSFNIYVYEL